MEDYFRVLIEKCKEGKLSAGDILSKVASTNFTPSQSENEVTNRASKPKSMHPEKYEKLMYKLPTSSLSASTKPTEFPDTQESELNHPSIAEGIEEPEEDVEDVIDEPEEEDDDVQEETETWNVMFEKQMKKRQDFWKQYKDRDLQQYIEEQLTTIFDNIRTVHSREQLEDIKRKCRLKWFLRMKKLRDSRRAREEEEFVENCSFHPKINDSSIRPRYLEIQTKPSLTYISRECTFSPDLSGKLSSKSTRSYGNPVKDSVKDTVRSLGNSLGSSKNSGIRQLNNKLQQPRTISDIEPQHSKNGKIYLDDDLNEFMGSLCSVETYQKESSPRMHIRELLSSQEENIRIEKTLSFTACKDKLTGDSRRHSMNTKAQSFLDKHGLKSSNTTKNIKQHDKDFSFERLAIPRAKSIKTVPKDPGFVAGDWNTSTKTPVNLKKGVVRPSLPTGKSTQETSTRKNRELSASRQERFTERKAEKTIQLDTEIKVKHPFKPQVSQASESLDKKASEEYSHRDKRLDERKDKKLKKLDKENQEKHPFKPQLSKAAQTLDRKVYEEKVANFVKNREERLEKLREQSALKELEGVTHQPKINKAIPASSKLGINLTTSEYITYLKEKEDVDRQFIEIAKKRKEAIEAIECTHTPQISVKPLSVKSEFSSPKVSLTSSQGAGYKDLHQKRKQGDNSNTKLTSWNFFQKENIYVPSLFDEGLQNELSFDQHEYSYKNGF